MSGGKTLVVSGVGKRNALLMLLRAEAERHSARIVGFDAAEWPPARLAVDHFDVAPFANDPAFPALYTQLLEKWDATGFLTLVDPEIVTLGALAQSAQTSAGFLHPVPDTARICEDKFAFFEHLEAHGLPGIPTFLTPLNVYPFIRKDRLGSAASGFRVFESAGDAERYAQDNENGHFIYQPFCAGTHYCVDAYFSILDGGLVDLCVKEVVVKTNGETYLLRAAPRDRFVPLVELMAQALPMRGIVNFDIYDEDGDLKVMEINCRIGGNYPASHAFGCNFLRPMLKELFYSDASASVRAFSDYQSGAMIAKYFEFSAPVPPGSAV